MISLPNPRNDVVWALNNPHLRRQVVKHPAKVNFLLAFWYNGKIPLIFYDENLKPSRLSWYADSSHHSRSIEPSFALFA